MHNIMKSKKHLSGTDSPKNTHELTFVDLEVDIFKRRLNIVPVPAEFTAFNWQNLDKIDQ